MKPRDKEQLREKKVQLDPNEKHETIFPVGI